MPYAAAFLAFISVFTLGLSFFKGKQKKKVDVLKRLGPVIEQEAPRELREEELKKPFMERALMPLIASLFGYLGKILPSSLVENLEPKVQKAGSPGGLSAGDFLGIKVTAAFILGFFAYFILSLSFLLVLFFLFVGWYAPELYLNSLVRRRTEEIDRSLPTVLDLLTVSVEAGLGFDSAMAKVSDKFEGLLAGEFQRVLKEVGMGKNRKEALRDMSKRLDNEDVTTFVGALIQADQLGISFSNILRTQSEQVRYKRRQRVEEAALKAPVKMLVPLVFFIFPTIFVVLLGPAVINIFTTMF